MKKEILLLLFTIILLSSCERRLSSKIEILQSKYLYYKVYSVDANNMILYNDTEIYHINMYDNTIISQVKIK